MPTLPGDPFAGMTAYANAVLGRGAPARLVPEEPPTVDTNGEPLTLYQRLAVLFTMPQASDAPGIAGGNAPPPLPPPNVMDDRSGFSLWNARPDGEGPRGSGGMGFAPNSDAAVIRGAAPQTVDPIERPPDAPALRRIYLDRTRATRGATLTNGQAFQGKYG